MKNNALYEQSKNFAVQVDMLCKEISHIQGTSNTIFQLRKSSSSIFANISEAQYPQSLPDMFSKLKIALKESMESESWLTLLFESHYIDESTFKAHRNACGRIRRMLIASCKTIENKIKKL